MASHLYSTRQSKIWAEIIEKENVTRLQWHQRVKMGDLKGESMRFEVFKKQLERNTIKDLKVRQLPPIEPKRMCRHSQRTLENEIDKTTLERVDKELAKSTSSQIYDMYPVDSGVREKLYEGFTREGKGRYAYLTKRKKIIPERRYQFPLCSSWDYGWRLEDNIPKESIKNPVYGRRAIVESDFFTRNQLPQYHKNRYLKPDDARATILMAD